MSKEERIQRIVEFIEKEMHDMEAENNMLNAGFQNLIEVNSRLSQRLDEAMNRQTAKWIPASDRLPKDGERVIVRTVDGQEYFSTCCVGAMAKRIAYWLPIPEIE